MISVFVYIRCLLDLLSATFFSNPLADFLLLKITHAIANFGVRVEREVVKMIHYWWSRGVVEMSSGKVEWSSVVVELSSGIVEWSSGELEWSSGVVEWSSGVVE